MLLQAASGCRRPPPRAGLDLGVGASWAWAGSCKSFMVKSPFVVLGNSLIHKQILLTVYSELRAGGSPTIFRPPPITASINLPRPIQAVRSSG